MKTLKEVYYNLYVKDQIPRQPLIDSTAVSAVGLDDVFAFYYQIEDTNIKPYESIDVDFCCVKYADRPVLAFEIEQYEDPLNPYENVVRQIQSVIYRNAYKWGELYKTMNYEYDPLWNVDGTEVTTYDEFEKQHDIAKHKITKVNGATLQTNTFVAQTVTQTNKNAPVDSATLSDTQQQITSLPLHADTVANNAVTNTEESDPYIDKDIEKKHSVTVERHGNIGVTKTTELIDSQRQIVNFDFYKIVMKDIIDEICVSAWK